MDEILLIKLIIRALMSHGIETDENSCKLIPNLIRNNDSLRAINKQLHSHHPQISSHPKFAEEEPWEQIWESRFLHLLSRNVKSRQQKRCEVNAVKLDVDRMIEAKHVKVQHRKIISSKALIKFSPYYMKMKVPASSQASTLKKNMRPKTYQQAEQQTQFKSIDLFDELEPNQIFIQSQPSEQDCFLLKCQSLIKNLSQSSNRPLDYQSSKQKQLNCNQEVNRRLVMTADSKVLFSKRNVCSLKSKQYLRAHEIFERKLGEQINKILPSQPQQKSKNKNNVIRKRSNQSEHFVLPYNNAVLLKSQKVKESLEFCSTRKTKLFKQYRKNNQGPYQIDKVIQYQSNEKINQKQEQNNLESNLFEKAIKFKKTQNKVESYSSQQDSFLVEGGQKLKTQQSNYTYNQEIDKNLNIKFGAQQASKSNSPAKEIKPNHVKNNQATKRIQNSRLPPTPFFVFNSEDTYIKNILQRNDWVLNPSQSSSHFTLKWTYVPQAKDYSVLKERQYLNHLKNVHQITYKNYLNQNLRNHMSEIGNLHEFYPKGFNITSRSEEREEFMEEYTKNYMQRLIVKLYEYIKVHMGCTAFFKQMSSFYQNLLQRSNSTKHPFQYSKESKRPSILCDSGFKQIYFENYHHYNPKFLLNIRMYCQAFKYWRYNRKKEELDFAPETPKPKHFLDFTKKQFAFYKTSLETYSRMDPDWFDSSPESRKFFGKEFYATPSQIFVERVIKEYYWVYKSYMHLWSVFGLNNIWIIKPSNNDRGKGIRIENQLDEIINKQTKKSSQNVIVQKYIEHPLLLKSKQHLSLSGKKFDIRQWVLITSVEPLQIHMFSDFYIRICSEQYHTFPLKALHSHLTNYSVNKHKFKELQYSVLSSEEFIAVLEEQASVNFRNEVQPKIKHLIISSIRACSGGMEDLNKRCFSLLGFDILLDQFFNPWLLEVNMSPACEERTPWLKQYLNSMGEGLLKIIFPDLNFDQQSQPLSKQPLKADDENNKAMKQIMKYSFPEADIDIVDEQQNWEGSEIDYVKFKELSGGNYEQKAEISPSDKEENNCKQQIQDKYHLEWERVKIQSSQDEFQSENLVILEQPQMDSGLAKFATPPHSKPITSSSKSLFKHASSVSTPKFSLFPQPQPTELGWIQIYSEESILSKKDQVSFQVHSLEVAGFKIKESSIKGIDNCILEFEEKKNQAEISIIKIQTQVRRFLRN